MSNQNQVSFEGKSNAEVKEVIFDLSESINYYQQIIQLARQELVKRAQEAAMQKSAEASVKQMKVAEPEAPESVETV